MHKIQYKILYTHIVHYAHLCQYYLKQHIVAHLYTLTSRLFKTKHIKLLRVGVNTRINCIALYKISRHLIMVAASFFSSRILLSSVTIVSDISDKRLISSFKTLIFSLRLSACRKFCSLIA